MLRPGFYTKELEFVSPTESDLAPMPKVSAIYADDLLVLSAITLEKEIVPPTESDLAPILKVSTVKADDLAAVSAVAIDYYAYAVLE